MGLSQIHLPLVYLPHVTTPFPTIKLAITVTMMVVVVVVTAMVVMTLMVTMVMAPVVTMVTVDLSIFSSRRFLPLRPLGSITFGRLNRTLSITEDQM